MSVTQQMGLFQQPVNDKDRAGGVTDHLLRDAAQQQAAQAGAAVRAGHDQAVRSRATLDEHEERYIKWVLKEAGNRTLAAQQLGIDRVSLWRKLEKSGLEEG